MTNGFQRCLRELAGRGIPREFAYKYCGDIYPQDMTEEDRARKQAYEQATRADKYVANELRLASKGIGFTEIIGLLIAVKLAQTPQGLKTLRDITVALIKAVDRSMVALAKASVGNPVSAWANPYLLSIIYERIGLVPSERMAEFRIGLSLISAVKMSDEIIETISSFVPFTKPEPSEFPTHIDYGDETYVVEKPEEIVFKPKEKKKGS